MLISGKFLNRHGKKKLEQVNPKRYLTESMQIFDNPNLYLHGFFSEYLNHAIHFIYFTFFTI